MNKSVLVIEDNGSHAVLIGEHDFGAFRSADCQALSPVKTVHRIDISQRGAYWRFGFHEDGVASALAALEHFKGDSGAQRPLSRVA